MSQSYFWLIPTGICWELWLNRCRKRFDNKRQLAAQIMKRVKGDIGTILSNNSLLLKRKALDKVMLQNLKVKIPVVQPSGFIILRWYSPSEERFKLNMDSCAKGNLGYRGGGVTRGFCNVDIEVDSMVLALMV